MRPAHKTGHPGCPHANWAACDKAQQVRWGQCKAMVGDREPTPCVRWAVGPEGWCWQHVASELERVRREAKATERKADLDRRIDEYMEWQREHPSIWDSKRPPTAYAPKPANRQSKRPHRLTSPA